MSEPRDSSIEASQAPGAEQQALRCQWCSVPLAASRTICPTCGSPGIPDPRMSVPGPTEPEASRPGQPANAGMAGGATREGSEPPEWWRDEAIAGGAADVPLTTMSFEDVERRKMQSLTFIGGAVLVCALLGWLIGPSLLVGPFERVTGANVEDLSDLRGMGAMGGMIAGMFIGATGGWVIWSSR